MVKARITIGRKQIIVLGLSGENITRLVANEPIRIKGSELGLDDKYEFIIMYGKTEEIIEAEIRSHCDVLVE